MTGADTFIDEKTGADVCDGWYRPNFLASGVYNLELNRWIIEPKFKRCYHLNGYVFCLKEDFVKGNNTGDFYDPDRFNYSYDLYQLGRSSSTMQLENVTKIENQKLSEILNLDSLEHCDDSDYYIAKKNDKEGFIHFRLFLPDTEFPNFQFSEIMAPQFDELFYEHYFSTLISINNNHDPKMSVYHVPNEIQYRLDLKGTAEFLLHDSNKVGFGYEMMYQTHPFVVDSRSNFTFSMDDDDKFVLTQYSESKYFDVKSQHGGFQIEFANDSLILIQNFTGDVVTNDVLISILSPGEDSVDQDGNFVFYVEEYGQEKSGVYNLNSKSWYIQPTAKSIRETGTGFLVEDVVRNNPQGLNKKSVYTLIDLSGNEIFSRIDGDKLFSNLDFLKYCFPEGKADSLFEAPNGNKHHTLLKNENTAYYVVLDSTLGVFEPEIERGIVDVVYFKSPQEFIHVNNDDEFQFWLAGDSLFVEVESIKKAVTRNHGKIVLAKKAYPLENDNWGDGFVILLINGIDTTIFTTLPVREDFATMFEAEIQIDGDIIIVNDFSKLDNSCVECTDEQGIWYGTYGEFETENSSVWKKINGKWNKVSPYYAEVIPIPGGYIARTGLFIEEYTYYESRESELIALSKNVPTRYFFLDSNLRVVPYMDYFDFPLIEDLGFGLKVCYDNSGCFFMTYNRVAVTDATWDDFELYNKKLKAIKKEVPFLDADGEPMFDEFGAPVMISESVIMFFKIP